MAKLLITRRVTFEAAHRLETWTHSKCHRLHGHSWVLEATWKGRFRHQTSCVIDFEILGQILKEEVFARWDHQYLNEVEAKEDVTSEYLAMVAYRRINEAMVTWYKGNAALMYDIHLEEVRVQETDNCWVTIRREDQPNE